MCRFVYITVPNQSTASAESPGFVVPLHALQCEICNTCESPDFFKKICEKTCSQDSSGILDMTIHSSFVLYTVIKDILDFMR